MGHKPLNTRVRRIDPATIIIVPGDYIRTLVPPWTDAEQIVPNDYFITTGDAVKKTEYLKKQIEELKNKSQELPTKHKFRLEVEYALLEVNQLLEIFIAARGTSVHLETEWEEGAARCRKTNPRGYEPRPDGPPPSIPAPLFRDLEAEETESEPEVEVVEQIQPQYQPRREREFRLLRAADPKTGRKLSFEIAEDIRSAARCGGYGVLSALAREYEVSNHTIRMIVLGKIWSSPLTGQKLTATDIHQIRELSKTTSKSEIARRFNVAPGTIRGILTGKFWKHVPIEEEECLTADSV